MTALPSKSQAPTLSARELILCIERRIISAKRGKERRLSLQDIATPLGVSESTVQRWKCETTLPITDNLRKLRALHDSRVCEHSWFRYICDHPRLDASPQSGYDDPSLPMLLPTTKLESLWSNNVDDKPLPSCKIIIAVAVALPEQIRSRSYQCERIGPPVYLILHRPGDEAAISPEVIDHIVARLAGGLPSLPNFDDPGAAALLRRQFRLAIDSRGRRAQPKKKRANT